MKKIYIILPLFFLLILISISISIFSFEEESSIGVNPKIEAIYYGSYQEKLNAVHYIGSEKIMAGLRPIIDQLEKRQKGELNLNPDLVARMCTTLGRLKHPAGNAILLDLADSSKKRITALLELDKKSKKEPPQKKDGEEFVTTFSNLDYRLEAEGEFIIGINALRALGDLDIASGVDKLKAVVSDKSEFMEFRVAALKALPNTTFSDDKLIGIIEKILEDEKYDYLKVQAAYTLLFKDGTHPAARKKLIELLGSSDYEVRRDVALAMMELKMSAFVVPLEEAIKIEDDERIRSILLKAEHECKYYIKCCRHP